MNTHHEIHQIHLYPPQKTLSENGDPIPRVDLLSKSSVSAIARFLQIFFPIQKEMHAFYDDRAMWVESRADLALTLMANAADLLAAIPSLNEWLDAWARSPERLPNLTPEWATDRRIPSNCVTQIAEAIRDKLSTPDRILIQMYSHDGAQYTLRIPSMNALMAPKSGESEAEKHVFSHIETSRKFQNSLGRCVWATGFSSGQDAAAAVDSLRRGNESCTRRRRIIDGQVSRLGSLAKFPNKPRDGL